MFETNIDHRVAQENVEQIAFISTCRTTRLQAMHEDIAKPLIVRKGKRVKSHAIAASAGL
jgi:hypothetical protein